MKILIGCLLIACALAVSGCQKGVGQSLKAQAVSSPSPKTERALKASFDCAGKTKEGITCKRHVKHQGGYCWQHIQQSSCYRPKGSQPVEDCYYEDGDTTRPINQGQKP